VQQLQPPPYTPAKRKMPPATNQLLQALNSLAVHSLDADAEDAGDGDSEDEEEEDEK
jgi:hypothetical protein